MQIPVDSIIVKKRIRRNHADIESLAESFKRYGQICPIVVSQEKVLIAGGRRLEAARYLGWRTIDAVISEAADELLRLELEVEENVQRRDFDMEEIAEASKRINRLKNPGFFRSIWNAIVKFFKKFF
ncbi:MAG TPA: chromosome partitioning protein ParB [Treponema sp.]|nr:chromosome partitioning protein ParB [Treponema sp.]